MGVRSDLRWVAYGLTPRWAFELRRRFVRVAVRTLRAEVERSLAELNKRHIGNTFLTGTIASASSSKRSSRWQCPTGHASMSSSVPMESAICYCGRSMVEIPENK